MKSVSDSLAGRAAVIELEPLSFAEARGAYPDLTAEQFLVRGGFPELYKNRDIDAEGFFRSYVATYLERDLRQLLQVTSLRDFERFVGAAALRIVGYAVPEQQDGNDRIEDHVPGPGVDSGTPPARRSIEDMAEGIRSCAAPMRAVDTNVLVRLRCGTIRNRSTAPRHSWRRMHGSRSRCSRRPSGFWIRSTA